MKKLIIAFFALASLPALASCNTIEGIGQDVGAAGDAVADTANDVKEDITDDDDGE